MEIEISKDTTHKMRRFIEKAKQARDKALQSKNRADRKCNMIKIEYEESQTQLSKIKKDYAAYRETLSGKDKWIIKQGDEIIQLKQQMAKVRKTYSNYKSTIENSKLESLLKDVKEC